LWGPFPFPDHRPAFGLEPRLYLERESLDPRDPDPLTRRRRGSTAGPPELAAETHGSLGRAGRDHLGPLADQGLGAGADAVAPQEAPPEENLPHLDRCRCKEGEKRPRRRQEKEAGDGERQEHMPSMPSPPVLHGSLVAAESPRCEGAREDCQPGQHPDPARHQAPVGVAGETSRPASTAQLTGLKSATVWIQPGSRSGA
jgi:hypothetical protein